MKTKKFFRILREYLIWSNRDYAIPMIEAMLETAKGDGEYRDNLKRWVRDGGSVDLRDYLCAPSTDMCELLSEANHFRYPFNEVWTAIDSSGMHIRRKTDLYEEFLHAMAKKETTDYADGIPLDDMLYEAVQSVLALARRWKRHTGGDEAANNDEDIMAVERAFIHE